MGDFRFLFYPTWRDACFFSLGVTIGLLTMWIFRKRLDDLPKKIKLIVRKAGHPAVAVYLPRGKGNFPKDFIYMAKFPDTQNGFIRNYMLAVEKKERLMTQLIVKLLN
jgi:hypothetical protein